MLPLSHDIEWVFGSAGAIALPTNPCFQKSLVGHKKEDGEKMASATGNDKQVPDRVEMVPPVIANQKRRPDGVTQSTD
jgi:hypothetical protein